MVQGASERDKMKYLEKIAEWRSLGFDVEGLEELLETDFEQFKKRRLEILRGQITDSPKETKYKEPEKVTDDILPDDDMEPETEITETEGIGTIYIEEVKERPRRFERVLDDDDEEDLALVGKPLPIEAPPPDDEDTILIGDDEEKESEIRRESKSSRERLASGVREVGEESEKPARKKKIPEVDDEIEVTETEAPMGVIGAEVPVDRKEKAKEARKKELRSQGRKKTRVSQTNKIIAVVIVGILIMTVLWWLMYTQDGGDGDNGNGVIQDLEAVITVDKESGIAGESFDFSADSSRGTISTYSWVFDTDFQKTSGFYDSIFVKGFFAPNEEGQKKYTVSLTVEAPSGQTDTDTITITINHFEVTVTEEKIGDSAKYRVNGDIAITNPEGIAGFTHSTGDLALGDIEVEIDEILLAYRNASGEPMTSDILVTDNTEDGFMNNHDVFLRHIQQNLDITGSMNANIKTAVNEYNDEMIITGTMSTDEKSFTDQTTDHTIKIVTLNDLQLDSAIEDPVRVPVEMDSKDTLTSYPDLRQVPTRVRLTDISEEPIGLGDEDTIIYGSVAYSWHVIATDQVMGTPALKLEFFVDSATLKANNIDDFDMYLWLGNNKPVALKTEIHAEFTVNDNDVVINYQNRLIEYIEGTTALSSQSCNEPFNSTHHYAVRYSDFDSKLKPEFASNWSYLPHLKYSSIENSFESFSPDIVMSNQVLKLTGVGNYLSSNPDAYVTTGYINRTEGELVWNLTMGEKDDETGYNVRVGETSGVMVEHSWKIDLVQNSSSEFWPVLTFAGSEYIFKNLDNTKINQKIFKNDNIDFDFVSYGVTSSLSYPTVDFTSISNFQIQTYSYFAQTKDGSFQTALDAETGQLLYTLEHEYSGIDLPY